MFRLYDNQGSLSQCAKGKSAQENEEILLDVDSLSGDKNILPTVKQASIPAAAHKMLAQQAKRFSRVLGLSNLITILFILLISTFAHSTHANYRDYYTGMHESGWTVSRTEMECSLNHKVDHYGVASFSLHAIEGVSFHLKVLRRAILKHKAELNSIPSSWKHNAHAKPLANIVLFKGVKQFRLRRNISVTMLAELEKGMEPTFSFYDKPAPADKVMVKLSVVHFWPAYKKFLECGQTLAQYKLKTINGKKVYFNTAKYNIANKFIKDLDKIAAYTIQNDNVREIVIEGHTDIIGGHQYNNKLSNNRAKSIKRYLIKRNVPAAMIKTKRFGKRQPVASNFSKVGRAKNRRAKVKIIKK
ncbi:hypothetical protein MNBD_GAMMA12-2968 [hydrothermal vent metagenome]|uniref:OmpA-like domain-containing protein n=1 Tax=hydrothermal vent metagenome TaxID=652676 RepID=A0A3B0YTW3_9ZZZZ